MLTLFWMSQAMCGMTAGKLNMKSVDRLLVRLCLYQNLEQSGHSGHSGQSTCLESGARVRTAAKLVTDSPDHQTTCYTISRVNSSN